jgi:hypothetical protein
LTGTQVLYSFSCLMLVCSISRQEPSSEYDSFLKRKEGKNRESRRAQTAFMQNRGWSFCDRFWGRLSPKKPTHGPLVKPTGLKSVGTPIDGMILLCTWDPIQRQLGFKVQSQRVLTLPSLDPARPGKSRRLTYPFSSEYSLLSLEARRFLESTRRGNCWALSEPKLT